MARVDLWPEPPSLAFQSHASSGMIAPADWPDWLAVLWPAHVRHAFGAHHAELWDWLWDIEQESSPDPFVAVWARGGGKSTSAELGAASLGVRGKRRYAVYVRETQDQADNSVTNIARLLESATVARYYPQHAERSIGKFGNSLGWRRNRLRTSGGFTVDALGLDTAGRGAKVDEQRPDLIILDDIDNKHDSPATTAKKIATLTTSILPAGAHNVAVLAIQNLIIRDGVFTRLVDGRADYLASRLVSGPHPAVVGLQTEWREDPRSGTRRAIIVAGSPTWAGQSIATCQTQIDRFGLSAFLKECQHQVRELAEGIALRVQPHHVVDLADDEAKALVGMGQPFAGIDFGSWRFAFVLRAADRAGKLHQIAEYFSQRDEMEDRARVITALCTHYGAPTSLRCWGDSANPTDIRELNAAFRRIKSGYRVIPVEMGNKGRLTAVERMNDLLDRNALLYRRGVLLASHAALQAQWKSLAYAGNPPDIRSWYLGMNASSAGTEMEGSRLLWEVGEWSYPVPKEGEAQKQDPDDHTADGADAVAADRYGLMSFWRAAKPEDTRPKSMEEARQRQRKEAAYDKAGDVTLDRISKQHADRQKALKRLLKGLR